MARSIAAGDDDAVTLCKTELALCDVLRGVEEDIGRGELLAHSGNYAPGERQLTPGILVGGETDDRNGGTDARYHSRSHTRQRAGNDGLGIDVDSHTAGGVRDRVGHIADLEIEGIEALLIVDARLGGLGDLCHCCYRLNGVLTCRGLAREHYRAGAVINGVGDVGYLGSRGSGVGDHRLEHLGGGDNALAEHTALGDELFSPDQGL